jgi:hypothetical protein
VISPRHGSDARESYRTDPPVADGSKVILLDTDHLWGEGGDSRWVWKSFLRGYQPIYMDRIAKLTGDTRGDIPGADGVRRAMGVTRRLAERVHLAAMTPRPELASTAYCLADPGNEYVVYLPDGGEATVDLSPTTGELSVEWVHPLDGTTTAAGSAKGGDKRTLKAPFSGEAVVHLWRPVRIDAEISAASAAPCLAAVRQFAELVLEHGRDPYGKPTPLFVDGLDVDTFEPVKWKWGDGQEWVLCNLSRRQGWLGTLDGYFGPKGRVLRAKL